ncbi:FtsL-like putative cell division protein [Sediminibacterium ginsengisoli]|uniref:Cell division protein FtsL n=1 Tax=Sediminibacterium ginsengisoli TaxID=413434 RepID=A0A1T4N1T8_9BACT|nr:FtsL-like putative cell division protein [Sediminibacterium ginsengisoli]SJZ73172.1 hypothetical protein SAMN04488132_10450 [Sediminibacterium ginsengisoli]
MEETGNKKTEPAAGNALRNPLKGLFNYQWMLSNIPFFLFLSLLAVLYIANGHMADKTMRRINATTVELKELQYEYKTLKSEVMFKSEEVQMVKATEPLGLKVVKEMPQRLQQEKKP